MLTYSATASLEPLFFYTVRHLNVVPSRSAKCGPDWQRHRGLRLLVLSKDFIHCRVLRG